MANGYGNENGSSGARWIVALVAGIVAFLLSKMAWHHDFWWALLIGGIVFLIVYFLWSLFGGAPDAGYGGANGQDGFSPTPATSPASAASAFTKTETASRDAGAALDTVIAAAPVAVAAVAASVATTSSASPAPASLVATVPEAQVAKPRKTAAKPAAKPAAAKPAAKPAAKAAKADAVKAAAKPDAAVKASSVVKASSMVKAPAAAKAPAKVAKAEEAKAPAATKAPKVAKVPAAAKAPAKAPAKPKAAKPAGPVILKAPRGGKADDLKIIEGIGPALEKLVNGQGVYHFDQIAAWSEADIAFFDGKMDRFKGRITRDKWVAQAKIILSEGVERFLERAKTNNY